MDGNIERVWGKPSFSTTNGIPGFGLELCNQVNVLRLGFVLLFFLQLLSFFLLQALRASGLIFVLTGEKQANAGDAHSLLFYISRYIGGIGRNEVKQRTCKGCGKTVKEVEVISTRCLKRSSGVLSLSAVTASYNRISWW
ncbi:hypothetical protein ACMFMG_001995 [Clarireedia jacksonii]